MKPIPPEFFSKAFNCPICGAFAHMNWLRLSYQHSHAIPFHVAHCTSCKKETLWAWHTNDVSNGARIIHPVVSPAPMPHIDLPDECKADYLEAREIVTASPRGAGALLRLCLEKLCIHLTGNNKNSINDNIASLVKSGLPIKIQQSLDSLRVLGNSAVHPKEINLSETPETVNVMFYLINLIVENQISEPKSVEAVYGMLPASAKETIQRRDGA